MNTVKNIDYIEKCFKQKLHRINFAMWVVSKVSLPIFFSMFFEPIYVKLQGDKIFQFLATL